MASAVVSESSTLSDLADRANAEYELAERAAGQFVLHAIRCGEALIEARAQCERRHWYRWLEQNFHATTTTAKLFIRVATYQDQLPPEVMNTDHARRLLRGLPAVAGDPHAHPQEVRDEALRLRRLGKSLGAIATELDIKKSTVHYWTNPARRKAQWTRSRRARKALQREESERRIKEAVRKTGGAIGEAYSLAERMQDVLGQAHSEATESEARLALSQAGEHYRKMRDEIVRALGVT